MGWFWWAGLVRQWSGVGVGASSDLWSHLRQPRLSGVVVWSGTDLMGCCCGLVPWPNPGGLTEEDSLVWRLKIKKMKSWGNSSEKGCKSFRELVMQRETEKKMEVLYFSNSVAVENSHALKTNTGLCWRSFQIFPFYNKNCDVHHHGNNPCAAAICSRERSRVMQ